jgi:hypothetical protein
MITLYESQISLTVLVVFSHPLYFSHDSILSFFVGASFLNSLKLA